jgi:23S rRNA pseudouridine2605 synthase
VPGSEFEQEPRQFERLQKVLARAGIGSRRVCEKLIVEQRVTVNGEFVELGEKVDPETSQVEVDGLKVGVRQDLVYYLLNKPVGVITTSKDPQERSTVVDLVPTHPRVFPVGRLDADTEGLILLTNDGDLTHYLTHPSFGIEKEYLVQVEVKPSRNAIRELRQGVELDDGITAPAKVSLVDEGLLKIVIHEGRNRQIRRMCESVGHPVIRLIRSRIGPIVDRSLRPGSFRELTNQELKSIRKILLKDFSN